MIGYLVVGLFVCSLCSGVFVDCSILLQFTCKAVSPGTHFVSAGFPVLSGALSDVGTENFRCWNFLFLNHNEDLFFCYVLLENEPEGGKKDFHGANIFLRDGTKNVHLR